MRCTCCRTFVADTVTAEAGGKFISERASRCAELASSGSAELASSSLSWSLSFCIKRGLDMLGIRTASKGSEGHRFQRRGCARMGCG